MAQGRKLSARRDWYVYRVLFASTAPAASSTVSLQIEADSDFWIQKLTYQVDLASASFTSSTKPIPLMTVQLTDTGSGRQLMNNPVSIAALFGSGELPYILPNPRLIKRNSTMTVAVTNYSAAATYTNLHLNFHGFKRYTAD